MRRGMREDVALPTFADDYKLMMAVKEDREKLVQFMADIFIIVDEAIEHGDTFITIGLNRGRTKVMLTITQGTDKTYVVGHDLRSFLDDAQGL